VIEDLIRHNRPMIELTVNEPKNEAEERNVEHAHKQEGWRQRADQSIGDAGYGSDEATSSVV
jgi:hypothetical protein